MNDREKLQLCIKIAEDAHEKQVDKCGQAYIFHPSRVMSRIVENEHTYDMRCAAVLHDVVEDCNISYVDLYAKGVPAEAIYLITLLTRDDGETYSDYINKISYDKEATTIKVSDLLDNLDPNRLPPSYEKYEQLIERYNKALNYLLSKHPMETLLLKS